MPQFDFASASHLLRKREGEAAHRTSQLCITSARSILIGEYSSMGGAQQSAASLFTGHTQGKGGEGSCKLKRNCSSERSSSPPLLDSVVVCDRAVAGQKCKSFGR